MMLLSKDNFMGPLKSSLPRQSTCTCFLSSLVFLLSWFSQGHKFLNYVIIFIDLILLIQRNINFKNDLNLIKGPIFIYSEKRKVWKLPWASLKKRKKRPSKFFKNRHAVLSISTLVYVSQYSFWHSRYVFIVLATFFYLASTRYCPNRIVSCHVWDRFSPCCYHEQLR